MGCGVSSRACVADTALYTEYLWPDRPPPCPALTHDITERTRRAWRGVFHPRPGNASHPQIIFRGSVVISMFERASGVISVCSRWNPRHRDEFPTITHWCRPIPAVAASSLFAEACDHTHHVSEVITDRTCSACVMRAATANIYREVTLYLPPVADSETTLDKKRDKILTRVGTLAL